jgi:predicted secreted Zn-dependent protease
VQILLCISVLLSFHSNAKVQITESFEYYSVSPLTKQNVIQALNNSSPIREEGVIFYGNTKYDIKWRTWWRTKSETTLKLHFTMPKLVSINLNVKNIWSIWYPNLEEHENKHALLAREAAYELDKKLMSLNPRNKCTVLEKDAKDLAHKLLNKLGLSNTLYDLRTNHGETEGAWIAEYL